MRPGDDLAALLRDGGYEPGDVLVVAHKVVSKAEGALRPLDGRRRRASARGRSPREHGKDPRHVQVDPRRVGASCCAPSAACSSAAPTTASCAPTPASTPPTRPRTARSCSCRATPTRAPARCAPRCPNRPAVVIADSFGRAWRHGQCDVAIGIAGLAPLDDWRGRRDPRGRELRATAIAIADEAAAAADLVRDKDSREPAVVVRGLERHVTDDDGPGAAALMRPRDEDLFL